MARTGLTQNYQRDGTVLESFDSATGWAITGAGSTMALNNSIYKTGTGSIQMDVPANANAYIAKTISHNFDMDGKIELDIYVTTIANQGSVYILFASVANFSKSMTLTVNSSKLRAGWNRISAKKSEFVAAGGEVWTNLMIGVRVKVYASAGNATTVYVDNLTYSVRHQAKLIWTCDDGHITQYDELYTYMATKGLKATCYIISSTVGEANYMTLANLQTLYAAGWDICNHTHNHVDLSALGSQVAVEAEIMSCREYLSRNGFTRDGMQNHMAYPYGAYNDNVLAAVGNLGFSTARSTINYVASVYADQRPNNYLLRWADLGTDKYTLATAQAAIDAAILNGTEIIIGSHHFHAADVPDGTDFLISEMQTLVDYIKNYVDLGLIDCVTMSEWWNGLAGKREPVV